MMKSPERLCQKLTSENKEKDEKVRNMLYASDAKQAWNQTDRFLGSSRFTEEELSRARSLFLYYIFTVFLSFVHKKRGEFYCCC